MYAYKCIDMYMKSLYTSVWIYIFAVGANLWQACKWDAERKLCCDCQDRRYCKRRPWGTARHCITLHHTATHCNTPQHTAAKIDTTTDDLPEVLQHPATHYITLQHAATHCSTMQPRTTLLPTTSRTLCNALQRSATHCNTLQHISTRRDTMQYAARHCQQWIWGTATHSNTLQHAATLCNTLQQTVIWYLLHVKITESSRFSFWFSWSNLIRNCDAELVSLAGHTHKRAHTRHTRNRTARCKRTHTHAHARVHANTRTCKQMTWKWEKLQRSIYCNI